MAFKKSKGRKAAKPEPDQGSAIVAPSVRVFTDWDPARIKSSERQADGGNLMAAASVTDWLLSDDRVIGTLGGRVDALLGLTPSFEPSGDKRRSGKAVKALEAGEDFWAAYPSSELRQLHIWALALGVAPGRHGWESFEDHGGRLLPMPEFWHPQTLRQDIRSKQWFIRDAANREHEIVAGDGEWILHTPYGANRPWAWGLWRSLARWVLLKHYAILDWARHGEKAAILVATAQANTTKEQRRELAEDLQQSGSDRVVALAVGFDLKLVEVSANTRDIYEAQVEAANAAIAILIKGGNLTTEVSDKGSFAAAKTQKQTGDDTKLAFDADTLSHTLNTQSLVWWAEYNFGDSKLAPWPLYPVEPPEDKKTTAESFNTLGDGLTKFDKLGFIIDEKKLIERFDLDFVTGRKSPEERAKEAADAAAAAGLPASGTSAPAQPGKTPAPAKKASARGAFAAKLASGDPLGAAPGFVVGQMYADDVVESATEAANAALEPTITAIAEAIEAADSFEDLEKRLRELYPTLESAAIHEIAYRAMLLGQLAGQHAVDQDN